MGIWPKFLLLAALLILAGCTTLGLPVENGWSYNPQNYQGCTVVKQFTEQDGVETEITWYDCKDKAHVAAHVDLNSDGNTDLTYTATDVVGSTAAQLRADVEKVFSDNGMEVTPAVVEGVVDTVLGL